MKRLVILAALIGLSFSAHAAVGSGFAAPRTPLRVSLAGCCPIEAAVFGIDVMPAGAQVPTFVELSGSASSPAGPVMTLTFEDAAGIPELADATVGPPHSYPVALGTDELPIPPSPASSRLSAILFCTFSGPYATSLEGMSSSGEQVSVDLQWSPIGQDAGGQDIPPPIQFSEGGAYVVHVGSPPTQLRTRASRDHHRQTRIAADQ